jgi:hypothetical protein
MSWATVTTTGPDGELVSLDTPSDWSTLRTPTADPEADVATVLGHLAATLDPVAREGLSMEWRRVVRVCAAGGATLIGFGAAMDPGTERIVSASLMLAPRRWYAADPAGVIDTGPARVADIPAGRAIRRVRLVRTPSPVGVLVEFVVDYTVTAPGREAWSVVLSSPALRHADQLLTVFDAVAGSLRITTGRFEDDGDDVPAFS